MNSIVIAQNSTDGLGHQVIQFSNMLNHVSSSQVESTIDFRNINFIHPTTILGISGIFANAAVQNKMVSCINMSDNVANYLSTVCFPNGIYPDLDSDWSNKLEKYRHKNYLPIVSFSTSRSNDATNFRDSVLTKINELIGHKLGLTVQERGAISYLISELTDNIVEHSGVSRGKIIAQYYPLKEFVEICILDEGKTILGSYQDARQFQINSDQDAILAATKGNSTKGKERGYGIPTSISLIVKGLSGRLCLVSGASMLADQDIMGFPAHWKGTMVSLKIPKSINPDWTKYI
jgi:anti-sigma regulatory factor (Ser/Thr protein kinase)